MPENAQNDVETIAPEDFDTIEAMNTAGFAEFLGEFDDAETFDMADTKKFEERFDAFQNKAEAASQMKALFQSQLKDLNLGIEFGDADLETHVGETMEAMAHQDPEKLNKIHAAFAEFHATIGKIAAAHAEIQELSKGTNVDVDKAVEALKKKEELLETAKESTDFLSGTGWATGLLAAYEKFAFGNSVQFTKEFLASGKEAPSFRSREEMEAFVEEHTDAIKQHEARLSVKKDYGVSLDSDSIEAELEKTRQDIKDTVENAQKLDASLDGLGKTRDAAVGRFKQIREALVACTGANEVLREIAKRKAFEKLGALISSDPEKAEKFLDSMVAAEKENALGVVFFEGDEEEFRSTIEIRIEEKVASDMASIVEKAALGPQAFDRLYGALVEIIKKPQIASYKGPAVRGFVSDTLASIAKDLGARDKGRAVLVRFIAHRISKIK